MPFPGLLGLTLGTGFAVSLVGASKKPEDALKVGYPMSKVNSLRPLSGNQV